MKSTNWISRSALLGGVAGVLAALALVTGCSSSSSPASNPDATFPEAGGDSPAPKMDVVTPKMDTGMPTTCAEAGAPPGGCTAAACTMTAGQPAVCVAGKCVNLLTTECQNVVGPATDDNAILVGALVSFHGSDSLNGVARFQSMALAVNEINATSGGVNTTDGCNQRPIVLVACDDSNAALPADAGIDGGTYSRDKAATHLTADLHVAGIGGPENSNNTIDVFNSVTMQALTVLMPMSSSSVDVTVIDGGTQQGAHLIWRMVPDDSYQMKAIDQLFENYLVKNYTFADAGLPQTGMKISMVSRNDAYGIGASTILQGILHVNGALFTDPANAPYTQVLTYNAAAAIPLSIVEQVLAFHPDVIIEFGLGEISGGLVAPYEDINNGVTVVDGGIPPLVDAGSSEGGVDGGVDGGDAAPPVDAGSVVLGKKPLWISTTSAQRQDLLNVIATRVSTGLNKRWIGTSSLIISPLTQAFYNTRFAAAYPDAGALTPGMPGSYDSMYMLALALQSNPQTNFTATPPLNVVKGLSNVVTGTAAFDVGPTNLKAALLSLRQGTPIALNGASSGLAFDPATGQEPSNYAIWCVRTDPATGGPIYDNSTGMEWNYKTNTLTGGGGMGTPAYVCPP